MAGWRTAAQVVAIVALLVVGSAAVGGDGEPEVVGSMVVDGQEFVLLEDSDSTPVYDVCAAAEPMSCTIIPALEPHTSSAVPTGDGGAVVLLGSRDDGPTPGDQILLEGAAVDATWHQPVALGYDVAAFSLPSYDDVYCLQVVRAAAPVQHIAVAGRDVSGNARC